MNVASRKEDSWLGNSLLLLLKYMNIELRPPGPKYCEVAQAMIICLTYTPSNTGFKD